MTHLKSLFLGASIIGLAACQSVTETAETETAGVDDTITETVEMVEEVVEATVDMPSSAEKLEAVLAAQPEDAQARFDARNPGETLAFFGIEPGMTVMEALPGGGWYSKIIMPYLGSEGTIVGAHYPDEMWPVIFAGASEERIAGAIARTAAWPETAAEWGGEGGPSIASYQMTKAGEDVTGQVDAALFIRALHNLYRTEPTDGYFSATIAETFEVVKPGGIVGVVQHRAPEDLSDEWADGNAGYLKQSMVVAAFEAAGFVLEEASELNANALDTPTEDDFVWRLPPTRAGADTEEKRAVVDAIGESDRMTLKFRKPE